MRFQKAKPTFLAQAGRQGAPSARKPFASKITKASQKKSGRAMSGFTKKLTTAVRKNGQVSRPHKTLSRPSGKTASSSISLGSAALDKRLSNYFMSHSPKLRSATGGPQTAPQAFKPRG